MKKSNPLVLLLVLTLLLMALALVGCSQKANSEIAEQNTENMEVTPVDEAVVEAVSEAQASETNANVAEAKEAWPTAMTEWGVPKIANGKLVMVSDQSVIGNMMVSGITYSFNVQDVDQAAYQAYSEALKGADFIYNKDSVQMALELYERQIDGGIIKVTLSYSDEVLTLIVHNSALAAARAAGEATPSNDSKSEWPSALEGIPAFNAGKHIETIALSENMYTITYQEVAETDIDAYRKSLLAAGFELQEDVGDEGYSKIEKNKAYSVGLLLQNNTLQLVIAVGTM